MPKNFSIGEALKYAGMTAAACFAAVIIYLWLKPVISSFLEERDRRSLIAPLVNEAKSLKINYESVLTYPYQTIGKPVVWCVQNRGEGKANCLGDPDKRLAPSPDRGMPLFYGSNHAACTDMLLIIKGVHSNFSETRSTVTFIQVEYVAQLEPGR